MLYTIYTFLFITLSAAAFVHNMSLPTAEGALSFVCLYAQKAARSRNSFFVIFENKPVTLGSRYSYS